MTQGPTQVGGWNQPGTRLRVQQPCPSLQPSTLSGWSLTFILSPSLPVAPRSLETPPPPSRRAHCLFPALRELQMAVQGSPRHECQLGTTVSCSGRLGPRPLDWQGPGRGERSPPPLQVGWPSAHPNRPGAPLGAVTFPWWPYGESTWGTSIRPRRPTGPGSVQPGFWVSLGPPPCLTYL